MCGSAALLIALNPAQLGSGLHPVRGMESDILTLWYLLTYHIQKVQSMHDQQLLPNIHRCETRIFRISIHVKLAMQHNMHACSPPESRSPAAMICAVVAQAFCQGRERLHCRAWPLWCLQPPSTCFACVFRPAMPAACSTT